MSLQLIEKSFGYDLKNIARKPNSGSIFNTFNPEVSASSTPEFLLIIREYLNELSAHLTRNDSNEIEEAFNLLTNDRFESITFEGYIGNSIIALQNISATILHVVDENDFVNELIECNHVKYTEIDSLNEFAAYAIGKVNKALNHYQETLDTSIESYIDELAAIFFTYCEYFHKQKD